MVAISKYFIIKVTKTNRGGKMMKGLAVAALTIVFGVIAYDKLAQMIEVVKQLIA